MLNLRMLRLSDPLLFLSAAGLIAAGFFAIFSTTSGMQAKAGADIFLFVKRQFFSLAAAGAGMAFFAYFDYERLKKTAAPFYALTLLLLAAVLFVGNGVQGAQRWFQLGPVSFQPSEISKLVLIIALAAFISREKPVKILPVLLLTGVPFALIFKQPDLGTALVFIVILLGMLTAGEASPRLLVLLVSPFVSVLLRPLIYLWLIYLILLALSLFLTRASAWDWVLIFGANVAVGLAFPFLWGTLKVYQRQRITAFLNPAADPYGAGYHTLQSKIAVGGGGLLGSGFLRGTQTQLQFIPEQHSDFIFSVIGEEFGFAGSLLVILLFAGFIWRTLVIAEQARDAFGSLLAAGIAVMMTFHVLANIGMVVGLLPVVGIPLPFLSFGGTSLFMSLCAVGILQSIAMRRQKIIF